MADSRAGQQVEAERQDKLAGGSVIGAHTLQHAYQQGFYVILPEIYVSLGLTPVASGALETVRRVPSSVTFSPALELLLDVKT